MIPPAIAFDVVIGANLRRLREGAGLRAAELAFQLDMDADRLAEIEGGLSRLTSPEMTALQRALGCGLGDFFDELPPGRLAS